MRIMGILGLAFLAGCTTASGPQVATVSTTFIPERAQIDVPAANLSGFELDVPRDTSKRVVKNDAACKAVGEADQNEEFWSRCGIHPVDRDSNLVIGFDRKNYEKFGNTMEEADAYIKKLNDRIAAANKEREYWKSRADQERARAEAEKKKLLVKK